MADHTGIEWTDATWNPIRGCSRVSAGCQNCYAEAVAARFSAEGQAYYQLARRRSNGEPQWTGEVRVIEEHIDDPLRWRKPRRIFVNSMSDLFHEKVSDETILRIFGVMAEAERHTFQILTKRPSRMLRWFNDYLPDACSGERPAPVWPLPNVWLGVSVENQQAADERIPLLALTPAAVRFLSCEPLLGPIDFHGMIDQVDNTGDYVPERIHWVIVGGESGHGARPCDIAWVEAIVAACDFAGVACFVKQLGSVPMMSEHEWRSGRTCRLLSVPLKLYDRKGGEMAEWPERFRVRQFPTPAVTV